MKLFKKVKRAAKNFMRATSREAIRDFEVLRGKLHKIAEDARAEAHELSQEIADLKARYVSELEEAGRAVRVADRINELLK